MGDGGHNDGRFRGANVWFMQPSEACFDHYQERLVRYYLTPPCTKQ